jgi:hypothetical protein
MCSMASSTVSLPQACSAGFGRRDGRVDQQRAMSDIMEEAGLVHQFHITPDIGHWYPDDLAQRIDDAVRHIFEGG